MASFGTRWKSSPLAAGDDGRGDLVEVGGGKDEDGVGRGFLERLEEGVEGALGEHVHFVEEVDLAGEVGRGVGDLLAQLPDVVDAAVAGGVHFDQVKGGAGEDGPAGIAGVARLAIAELAAVDGPGEDAGGRRFAGAARPAEQVGVAHPGAFQSVAQRPRDMLLPDHGVKSQWSPLQIESLFRHRWVSSR
jgi:hypothetical protein